MSPKFDIIALTSWQHEVTFRHVPHSYHPTVPSATYETTAEPLHRHLARRFTAAHRQGGSGMNCDVAPAIRTEFDSGTKQRSLLGFDMIVHCHHYNALLQSTIEAAATVDGKAIFVTATEAVFYDLLVRNLPSGPPSAQWDFAAQLYSQLGFGTLDFGEQDRGLVIAPTSHTVEGFQAGFPCRSEPVCSITEGYLQAAHAAVTGELVEYRETCCQIHGADHCLFEMRSEREHGIHCYTKRVNSLPNTNHDVEAPRLPSPNIDETSIIAALAKTSIVGNREGLIPNFNVYLANVPADIYNLATLLFLDAMESANLGDIGRQQLIDAGETCVLNTFRGMRESEEWATMIAPHLKNQEDELFAAVAISNFLGWGNWEVTELTPGESLQLRARNSYESRGYRELRGPSIHAQCLMLTGAAAGLFGFVYGEGAIEDRFGLAESSETSCRCRGSSNCTFRVDAFLP